MNSASPGDAGAGDADAGDADAGKADGGDADAGNANDAGEDASSAEDAGTDAGKANDTGENAGSAEDAGAGQRDDAATPQQPTGAASSASAEVPEVLPFYEILCSPTLLADSQYAQGNEFWLGNQSEMMLRVDGYGYFASFGGDDATPAYRYSKTLALSVRPDGTLEDHAGYALLGYSAHPVADAGCLTTLRAPIALPPKATSRLEATVNLSSQSPEATMPFDITNPALTAIAAPVAVPYVDPDGRSRSLALYFEHLAPGSFRYHIVVPRSDIYPGETGLEELNFGDLDFDAAGALYWERSPETCKQFAGASASSCFTFDFGKSIGDDGATELESSTSLPSATVMSRHSSDGYAAGTGTWFEVGTDGVVQVLFDNGQTRAIGTLSFARFPKEEALRALDGTTFLQTEASGAPAFGKPGGPGRGSVLR